MINFTDGFCFIQSVVYNLFITEIKKAFIEERYVDSTMTLCNVCGRLAIIKNVIDLRF